MAHNEMNLVRPLGPPRLSAPNLNLHQSGGPATAADWQVINADELERGRALAQLATNGRLRRC